MSPTPAPDRIAELRSKHGNKPKPKAAAVGNLLVTRDAYSVEEVLERYPISRTTLYSWISKGLVKSAKIGSRRLVLIASLLARFEQSGGEAA